MKKFFCICCLFWGAIANVIAGNYFELTPHGFKSAGSKDFVVVAVDENKTGKEILSDLRYCIQNTLPVDNDNSWIVNENQIMVSSYKLDLYRLKAGPLVNFIMDLDFTLRFEVKDGKFRIDAPIIKNIGVHRFMIPRMVVFANLKDYKEFTKKQFIFNYSDGSVRNAEAKYAIESYINNILSEIIEKVKANNNTEDW